MAQVKVVIEVSALSQDHGYIKGWETFDFKGEPRNRLWTVWTRDIANVNEGDVLNVTGDLSTKTNTYLPKNAAEPKTIVEHSLNNVALGHVANKTTQVRQATDILTQTDPIDMPF